MSDFDKAAEVVKTLASVSQDDQLILYKYFKQASVGNINTDRPGFFDQKGRYKWDAWKSVEGMSQDDAKNAYVEKVKALGGSW